MSSSGGRACQIGLHWDVSCSFIFVAPNDADDDDDDREKEDQISILREGGREVHALGIKASSSSSLLNPPPAFPPFEAAIFSLS